MRTAFLYAQRNDYDAVVQVDADGQHIPTHIPDLLDALEGASVVVGARFTGHGDYSVRGPRRWAMRVLARSLSRVCRANLTDTTSGFRAADRRAISLFARHYPAEYLGDTVESLVIAARAGLPVVQVPVEMRATPGRHGKPLADPRHALPRAGPARALRGTCTPACGGPRPSSRSGPR